MQFNSINIRVFREFYAYCRLKHHSEFDDVPDISHICSCAERGNNYNEGETYCNNADFWYNYPKHIAIIIDEDDCFMLQTLSDNKVGKLYTNIEENEKEIRAFFENAKGDIVLLENKFSARSIKPDYDSLLLYTKKIAYLKKHTNEFDELYLNCRESGYALESYKKNATQNLSWDNYNTIIDLAKEFIMELAEVREFLQDMEKESLNDIIIPVSNEEASAVSFALLYRYYLKSKKRRSFHDRELISRFTDFVKKHPEAIDYFCEWTGNKFKKEKIVTELKSDNIIATSFDSVADEILA